MKKLTFYLFKSDINAFDQTLKTSKLGSDGYRELPLSEKGQSLGFEFKIYIEENKNKPPKWVSFFQDYTEYELNQLKNSVNSFVVLIKVPDDQENRFFAVTGGFGFNALNKDNLELNFGLRTTLNSIDPQKLKFIDAKNIDVRTRQKRVVSNVSTEVFDFDIDFDEELVRIVSGTCSDSSMGKKMTGADSLSLNCELALPELGEKCTQLLSKFKEETYKDRFEFIDNIQPVKDKSLILSLDSNLIATLKTYDFDSGKLAIAYPDQIEYERCTFFKVYGTGQRNFEIEEVDSITITNILQALDNIDEDTIKSVVKIVGMEDENKPFGTDSLYGFFVYETELSGTTYVLSNKKWFKVSDNYKNDVDLRLRSAVTDIGSFLHDWTKFDNKYLEGKYNDTYRTDPEYLVMDKELFQVPNSKSKIEVADLYHNNLKRLICVKKLSASSTLSHLFAQGSVSIDLLKSMSEYRTKYEHALQGKWGNVDSSLENLKLTYAIGTKKNGDVIDIIPFFSKVNLLHHAEFVRKMGVKVEVAKIKLVN